MTTRKPRQRKTPRQRAEEALAVETRRVEKLTTQWKQSKAETDRLARERDAAIRRRDYLAESPDLADEPLPDPEQDPITEEEK